MLFLNALNRFFGLGILLFTVFFAVDLFAAESDEGFITDFDFISLSKKKERAFDLPSAIYVLSAEDIRRSGFNSIPEVLRLVPGLQVAKMNGNSWAISSRGFNRQYSNKLLIMIDGRVVYNSIFSGALWDDRDYVIDDIEKIEVIRGPGGAIWGANAVNGIINIITKKATDTQGTYLSQIVGNGDRSITEARYGGEIDNGDNYRFYAKRADRRGSYNLSDGRKNDDGILHNRFGFRYDFLSLQNKDLTIHGDFFDGESQNYFTTIEGTDRNDRESTGGNVVVKLDEKLSKKSSIMVQAYFDYAQSKIPILSIEEQSFDVDFQHYYNFSQENRLIWGLGYRNTKDNIDFGSASNAFGTYNPVSYSPDSRNIDLFSAFVQDKIGLIPNELYLTLGSKFEHNDLTGFEYQPSARLSYFPSRNETVWASVSRAVRTPTRGEDNIEITSVVDGVGNAIVNKGSNDYEAEDVIAYEFGYRNKISNDFFVDLAVFYNDYSDLRTFESDSTLGTPISNNKGYGETYGFEIDTKWQISDNWKVEASYEFLKMNLHLTGDSNEANTDLNSGKLEYEEEQSPQNQIKIRSLYNIGSRIEFDNILLYTDSVAKARVEQDNGEKGVPSYVRWDSRIGYLVNNSLDLSFGVQNILDDKHQEYSPGLFNVRTEVPRTYYVKAVLQF